MTPGKNGNMGRNDSNEFIEKWLENSPTREQIIYLSWRISLRKLVYINSEIGEWLGPKETVIRRYFLPTIRSILIARYLEQLGENAGRVANFARESTEFIDDADCEEGAIGVVIFCRLVQLMVFGSWADGINLKKLFLDVFKQSLAIDVDEDSDFLEVLNDIKAIRDGINGKETLFSSKKKLNDFKSRIDHIFLWASEYDSNFNVWKTWIYSICSNNTSFNLPKRKAEIFDFVIATKPDSWWRGDPKSISVDINEILQSLESKKTKDLSTVVPKWSRRVSEMAISKRFDFFISHASEDKKDIARPLAKELRKLGYTVWFDETDIEIGDSLRGAIDRGLSESRYGIVVISPSFFQKTWPKLELDGLFSREVSKEKVILPIWHKINFDEVLKESPMLAGRLSLSTNKYTVNDLARKLAESVF